MTAIANDGTRRDYIDDTLMPRTDKDIEYFVKVLEEMLRDDVVYYLERYHMKPHAIFVRESDYDMLMDYYNLYTKRWIEDADVDEAKPIKFYGFNIFKFDTMDAYTDKLYWFGF